jgi:lipopolysaccharide export system protein LptA
LKVIVMKKIIVSLVVLIALLSMTGCGGKIAGAIQSASSSETGASTESIAAAATPDSMDWNEDDLEASWDLTGTSYITLNGDSLSFAGEGAVVSGNRVTIVSGGTYVISGRLNDGQIIVSSEDMKTVHLVLDGAEISCSTSAPLYVADAGKAVITLAGGTKSTVTDGETYVYEAAGEDEPGAAIFSKSDLTINGTGSLTVNANFNNAIQSKDVLKIVEGTITINAVNDGIKGRDSVAIRNGNIKITSGGDGIQSNNDEDPEKGTVIIQGGNLDIIAGLDGIQAETAMAITGGQITVVSGGGSSNAPARNTLPGDRGLTVVQTLDDEASTKGLKAGTNLTIAGGTINVDACDDALHSNGSLAIYSGETYLVSGDDGIHADTSLVVDGGNVEIKGSYEGMESAHVTINEGNIHIQSSDDGINVKGENGEDQFMRPPGQVPEAAGDNFLIINGGYIAINASGDGLDINGSIKMTGGQLTISGPTANDNSALDYYGTFEITGGYLVAAGSSGMAQAPSLSSTQNSVLVNLASAQAAGTIIHIETEDGEDILTYTSPKPFQSVVLCSLALQDGTTHVIYTGGSATGTATDGIYSGGSYTPGSQIDTFTISSTVTTIGSGGGFQGGPGGRGQRDIPNGERPIGG